MMKILHPVAGAVALLTIGMFWLSTLGSELAGSTATVVAVKTAVPWGFLLLIPALAVAAGSGFALAGGAKAGLIGAKRRRMPLIIGNGLLILIPAAFFLAARARAGDFDIWFCAVQGLELLAGAANVTLLFLSMRDGFRLTRRFARKKSRPAGPPE